MKIPWGGISPEITGFWMIFRIVIDTENHSKLLLVLNYCKRLYVGKLSEHCMMLDISAQLPYVQHKYLCTMYLYKDLREISVAGRHLIGMASHSIEMCIAVIVLS